MNIDILKIEIDTDPLTRGYSGMTDQQVADSLNTENRQRNKEIVTGSDVFRNVDTTEFDALQANSKRDMLLLCALDELDPFGPAAGLVQNIFGAGPTLTALQAFRVETVSRATEIGLPFVKTGHVEQARRL